MFRVEGLGVRVWGLRGHVLRSRGGLESEVDDGPRRAWGVEVMGLLSRTGYWLFSSEGRPGVTFGKVADLEQARCDML